LNRGFACQHPVPSDYPNKELVEIFQRMQQFRELDGKIFQVNRSVSTAFANKYSLGDAFSAKAYRAAVVALKCYPDPLTHINQVRQIRNVGSKITRMIEDYLANGRILDYGKSRTLQLSSSLSLSCQTNAYL
jgi:DNA polymerase/3'-5' exonuclease PolX